MCVTHTARSPATCAPTPDAWSPQWPLPPQRGDGRKRGHRFYRPIKKGRSRGPGVKSIVIQCRVSLVLTRIRAQADRRSIPPEGDRRGALEGGLGRNSARTQLSGSQRNSVMGASRRGGSTRWHCRGRRPASGTRGGPVHQGNTTTSHAAALSADLKSHIARSTPAAPAHRRADADPDRRHLTGRS